MFANQSGKWLAALIHVQYTHTQTDVFVKQLPKWAHKYVVRRNIRHLVNNGSFMLNNEFVTLEAHYGTALWHARTLLPHLVHSGEVDTCQRGEFYNLQFKKKSFLKRSYDVALCMLHGPMCLKNVVPTHPPGETKDDWTGDVCVSRNSAINNKSKHSCTCDYINLVTVSMLKKKKNEIKYSGFKWAFLLCVDSPCQVKIEHYHQESVKVINMSDAQLFVRSLQQMTWVLEAGLRQVQYTQIILTCL